MDHPINDATSVDVTLFVPCYNEEENIIPTLAKIVTSCRQVGCSYEILVFDDCSTDRSQELLRQFKRDHPELPLRIYYNSINQGLAHNFIEAALLGRGKHIRIVCGDDVETIETQVAILSLMGQADVVVPYHVKVANKGWFRTLLSRTYTRLVNFTSGYRMPYWNGCGLFYRYHVLRWQPNTRGFGFQALLLSKVLASGATFVPVLCQYRERVSGKSRALSLRNLGSVIHALLSILLVRLEHLTFGKRAWVAPRLLSSERTEKKAA